MLAKENGGNLDNPGFAKRQKQMTGEEIPGPAGPKVLRLFYFIGAGFLCTIAINKWKEIERKQFLKQQQLQQLDHQLSGDKVNAAHRALD